MVRALVSAETVTDALAAHVNRANDAARRLGCSVGAASEATRLGAEQLIDDLERRPETVRDLVGGFLARVRAQAEALRLSSIAGLTDLLPSADAPAAVLQSAAQRAAVEQALDTLSDEDRFALLARDSYDLTVHQTAVALSLDAPESARAIALARLSLTAAIEQQEPISLAGHDIAVGDLGQLADGSAPPGGRFATLRRHVSGCAQCAGVLDVQSRAAAMLSALPVLALDDTQRDAVVGDIARYAAAALPTEVEIRQEFEDGTTRRPLIEPLAIIGALLVAAILGGGVGALLSSHPTNKPVEISTPSTSPTPSSTAGSPSASATSSSPLVIVSTSLPPSATPTSPTTSKPQTPSPTGQPTTATATPTTTPTTPSPSVP